MRTFYFLLSLPAWVASLSAHYYLSLSIPAPPALDAFRLHPRRLSTPPSQVCHHPPIGAGHAETPKWTYDITSAVKTKFMGNWVDIYPLGRTRIVLKRTNEAFNIITPTTRINNIIVGRTWMDSFGELKVCNLTTGASAVIKFKECGLLGGGRWEVSGEILNAAG